MKPCISSWATTGTKKRKSVMPALTEPIPSLNAASYFIRENNVRDIVLPQLPLRNPHVVVVQDVEVVLETVRRDFAPSEGLQHLAARFVRV